jgi:hypothetical protein
MIRAAIGAGVILLALAVLAAGAWWLLTGHGRHRKPRHTPAPALLAAGDGPDGTGPVVLDVPPAPSALPDEEGQAEAGGTDPDTVWLKTADRADYDHCPAEGRRTPHFLHRDGSRTCCLCETTTAGEQT